MLRPVLIADDSEEDIVFLIHTLRQARIENPVVSVANAESVIDYLTAQGLYSSREKYPLPALIFLDARMPGHDGFYALEWISKQSEFSTLPVVMLTGSLAVLEASHAYQLGAVSVISKPCKVENIKTLPLIARQWLRFTTTD